MAVAQITTYTWTALALDTKPTDSTVLKGATLIVTDTGAKFVFDGTGWLEVSPKTRV